ncbi:hypothetical protein [Macrococcus animalis]|uniref:hypothetical protein n=1 Tax=Macrococcus animalis TaxID=3395467 RepID=UPI0039BEE9E7
MKNIIALCILTLVLTGCYKAETKVAQKPTKEQQNPRVEYNSPTVEMKFVQNNQKKDKNINEKIAKQNIKQLNREISHEIALQSPKVKPISNKYEFVDTVKDYSKEMDQVIDTMTLYENKKEIDQQLKKVKTIVVKYEAKAQSANIIPQIKNIDLEVKKANEKYIQSLGKIASAIQIEDEALKEDGYTDFSEGHNHLNKAYYQVQSIEETELVEASVEPAIKAETYTTTNEAPSLEIVMYKANGTEGIPIEENQSKEKISIDTEIKPREK